MVTNSLVQYLLTLRMQLFYFDVRQNASMRRRPNIVVIYSILHYIAPYAPVYQKCNISYLQEFKVPIFNRVNGACL